jgi:hypothetical protein
VTYLARLLTRLIHVAATLAETAREAVAPHSCAVCPFRTQRLERLAEHVAGHHRGAAS